MSRSALLKPSYLTKKSIWYLSVPPSLSSTGKRKQEYFKTKKEAQERATILKKLKQSHLHFAQRCTPALMESAVECEELAVMYGYSGFREAFLKWSKLFENASQVSFTLCDLLAAYEADHQQNWSHGYLTARWKPFRKKMIPIENEMLATMTTDFWREWASKWREEADPAPTTYNQTMGLIRGVFRHEKAVKVFPSNPLEPLPALKSVHKEVCVSTPVEVQNLLNWCLQHDPELLPYFVLGFFAGLRPISELKSMTFEQINFSERILKVVTTKTASNPKRQVPLEENAFQWIRGCEGKAGLICPPNLNKRVNKAKKESGITWGHDIMRHSYGSYWEAAHRKESGCREQLSYNMGHSTFKTYEQNYRNDRSEADATAYWSILPPR